MAIHVEAIEPQAVAALRRYFRGALLRPGEEGYDEARRIWNGAIDRRPALIARCAGADDVVEAVRFAREHDLPRLGPRRRALDRRPVRLRRRAHDRPVADEGDPGRPGGATARAAGGAALGRAGPGHPTVRPGHHRRHHQPHRHRRADPRRRTRPPDAQARPDRRQPARRRPRHRRRRARSRRRRAPNPSCSGGCAAGAATSASPPASSTGSTRSARWCSAARCSGRSTQAPRCCARCATSRPTHRTNSASPWPSCLAPPAPFVPPEWVGRPVLGLILVWAGDPAAGQRPWRRCARSAHPIADAVRPIPVRGHAVDAGRWCAARAALLLEGTPTARTDRRRHRLSRPDAWRPSRPFSQISGWAIGGAVSRVDPTRPRSGDRDTGFEISITVGWRPDDPDGDRHIAWVRDTAGRRCDRTATASTPTSSPTRAPPASRPPTATACSG